MGSHSNHKSFSSRCFHTPLLRSPEPLWPPMHSTVKCMLRRWCRFREATVQHTGRCQCWSIVTVRFLDTGSRLALSEDFTPDMVTVLPRTDAVSTSTRETAVQIAPAKEGTSTTVSPFLRTRGCRSTTV